MRVAHYLAASALIVLSGPAFAQTAADPDNVKAEDVALAPLSDINLRKKDVPPILQAALKDPYDTTGLKSCVGYTTAIASLDEVLGDDIDVADEKTDDEKMANGAGAIAKSIVSSFVPFRGIIRQLSGANDQQRAWNKALYAGSVRRAFLKGLGQSKGCAYPARPATAQVLASLASQRAAALAAKKQGKAPPSEQTAGEPVTVAFESRAVVQSTAASRR